jgi:hypothetical protein
MQATDNINMLNKFVERAKGKIVKFAVSINRMFSPDYEIIMQFDNEDVARFFANAFMSEVTITPVIKEFATMRTSGTNFLDSPIEASYERAYAVNAVVRDGVSFDYSLKKISDNIKEIEYELYSEDFDQELDKLLKDK